MLAHQLLKFSPREALHSCVELAVLPHGQYAKYPFFTLFKGIWYDYLLPVRVAEIVV